MTKCLQDANNYLRNHLDYDCVDIPEEDICTLINIHNNLIKVLNKLAEDGRIVSNETAPHWNNSIKE